MVEEEMSFEDVSITDVEQEVDNLSVEKTEMQEIPRASDFEEEEPTTPESMDTVSMKWRVTPAIPNSQKKNFDPYKGFFGQHVALSNTKRMDNLVHLDAIDAAYQYDKMAMTRHRATMIRIRETSEFQMCRSNPEIGGFEAKIPSTTIRREDVDVRQTQTMGSVGKKKRGGMLGFLRRKKE